MKSAQFFHSQKNKRPFFKIGHSFVQETVIFIQCQKKSCLIDNDWMSERQKLISLAFTFKNTQSTSKKLMDFRWNRCKWYQSSKKKHDESCLNLGFHHFKSRSKCDSFDQIWQIKIHWRTPRSNWWERAWKAKANVCLAWSLCLFSFFVFLVWCVYRLKSIAIARTCSIPLHHAWSLTQSLQFIWIAFHQIKYGPHDHSLPIKSTCEIHYIEWE